MKKLLALFAALVALCLIGSVALAEVAPVEEPVGEIEFELAPEDIEVAEPEVAKDPHETDDSTVEWAKQNLDKIAPEGAVLPDGTVQPADGKLFMAVVATGDCEKGTVTIWRYKCENPNHFENVDGGQQAYHEYSFVVEHIWASDHDKATAAHPDNPWIWGKIKDEDQPTCTKAGQAQDFCLVCGKLGEYRKVNALGHSWERNKAYNDPDPEWRANLVIDTDPTCVADGKGHFECVDCGEKMPLPSKFNKNFPNVITVAQMKKLIEKATTWYDAAAPKPTQFFDSDGLELSTMDAKGNFMIFSNVEAFYKKYVDWDAHAWSDWHVEKAATCFEEGNRVRHCERAGCALKIQDEPIPLLMPKLYKAGVKVLSCYDVREIWKCEHCQSQAYVDPANPADPHSKPMSKNDVLAQMDVGSDPDAKPTALDYAYNDYLNDYDDNDVFHTKVWVKPGTVDLKDTPHYKEVKSKKASHEKDEEKVKEILKAIITDDVKTDEKTGVEYFELDGKRYYQAETCEADGWIVYPCWHEKDDQKTHDEDDTYLNLPGLKFDGIELVDPSTDPDTLTDTQKLADPSKSYFYTKLPATGHDWSAWTLRYETATSDYYLRVCKICNKSEERIVKHGTNPEDNIDPQQPDEPTPVVPNKFAIDLSGVNVNGNATSGAGEVKRTEGNEPLPENLYARITWSYVLSDGSTFAWKWTVPVSAVGDTLNFIAQSGDMDESATLDEIQVALVTNADAHLSPEYTPIATAKK